MSKAWMLVALSMWRRMESVHGSAPNTPTAGQRLEVHAQLGGAVDEVEEVVGVQQMAVAPKSFMTMICRSVLPRKWGSPWSRCLRP